MFTCNLENPYCYYGAKMVNHSIGGVYFESRYPLEPGSVIFFNRASYSLDDYSPDTYKPHRVLVKWCREMPGKKDGYYGIGVEFFDPLTSARTDHVESPAGARLGAIGDTFTEKGGIYRAAGIDHELTEAEKEFKTAMEIAESKADKLTVLNRFATSVSSTLDLGEILQSVCREMTQIFGARNTGIGLLDRKRTKITLVAFYAADPEESDVTGLDIPLKGNAAVHRVVETGQAIVVPDVQHNPLTSSIHDIARKRGTECLMIVPLLTRGEVIGTIGMPTADKNRVFSTEEVSLAQTIASQIASAIENARLFERTEKARERAEHDLEIGRKIQTEFFPEKLPDVPGWEIAAHFQPARKVSGDFYDLFPVGGRHCLGLVMADVCDHGVGSALFMVLFRSLIRAYAELSFKVCETGTTPDPELVREALAQTIRLTNTYIATTHERSGMFATMFISVLDPETGRLNYANCGHEAPLILGPDSIEDKLKPTGPAVGLDADHCFSVSQVQIGTGQTLFVYTDGVTDAQNPDNEYFTKSRLMEIISRPFPSAVGLIHSLETRIQAHVAGADLYDDVTLMAIRRK